GYPQFDSAEIDNEREVVLEEIKRGIDSPSRQASQLFFSTAYEKHPYGVPVIGYDKNVKNWPAKKIKDYFHSRYSPQNMFLVVAGDFQIPEMKKRVDEYFGEIKKHTVRKSKIVKVPVSSKQKLKTLKTDINDSYLYVSFPIPHARHKDVQALDVIGHALGQGDNSRLVKRLRLDKPVVNSISASAWTPQQDGAFLISATLSQDHLEESLNAICEEIVRLRHDGITEAELQRSKTALSAEEIYGVETVDGMSRKVGSGEFYFNDPDYYSNQLSRIQKLTKHEVNSVIKKYFDPQKMTAILTSKMDKTASFKMMTDFGKNLVHQCNQAPVVLESKKTIFKKSVQKTKKYTLDHGTKVYLRKMPGVNSLTIRSASLGGARGLLSTQQGLTELLSRVWTSTTQTKDEQKIISFCDETASSISAYSGRNSFGLNMDSLTQFFDQSAHLFEEFLTKPKFEQTYFDREREVMLHQITAKNDHPTSVMGRMFYEKLFWGHPYSYDTLGTKESIGQLTPNHLQTYLNQQLTSKNFHICIAGDFSEQKMMKWLSKLDQNLPHFDYKKPQFKLPVRNENQFLYSQMKKEQSHMMVGFYGLKLDDTDRDVFEVMDTILSGMGGRLFQELREKKSLAYSVATQKFYGVEAGFFGSYIGCSPEKVDTALSMMLEEFYKLMTIHVSDEELSRAIQNVIGSNDIALQKKSAIANTILFDELYSLDSDLNFEAEKRFRTVTQEQIKNLANRLFSQHFVCALVGPQDFKTKDKMGLHWNDLVA
ncbi:MAG: M16 family metallopeptidase, partial [Pseudobdellovibrionaceae bacterium]